MNNSNNNNAEIKIKKVKNEWEKIDYHIFIYLVSSFFNIIIPFFKGKQCCENKPLCADFRLESVWINFSSFVRDSVVRLSMGCEISVQNLAWVEYLARLGSWYSVRSILCVKFTEMYSNLPSHVWEHSHASTYSFIIRYIFFSYRFVRSLFSVEKVYEYLYRTLCASIEIFVFTFNRIRFISLSLFFALQSDT